MSKNKSVAYNACSTIDFDRSAISPAYCEKSVRLSLSIICLLTKFEMELKSTKNCNKYIPINIHRYFFSFIFEQIYGKNKIGMVFNADVWILTAIKARVMLNMYWIFFDFAQYGGNIK